MVEESGNRAAWQEAVVRAAAEASRLQPLATFFLVAAALGIVGSLLGPFADALSGADEDSWRHFFHNVIEAAPAVALAWALWETRNYLTRLSRGDVWGPATTQLLGRVGDSLLWAAALSVFVVPNLQNWTEGDIGGFTWNLEAQDIVLAGLGLLLSLIGRVVRNVVEVAATLKAENDQIV